MSTDEEGAVGKLSFAQVREAGLPARAQVAGLTYEYRPLADEVVVSMPTGRLQATATHRVPDGGWSHQAPCTCRFCLGGEEVGDEQGHEDRVAVW